jgi:Fe-S cluster biosynthesis and repair protein YggX
MPVMDSALDERIARFEYMANADPRNEMAHFSLGSAYLQAQRAGEAAESFLRAIELNPEMSKAYQLAGEAMIAAGWTDRAVETLERGYEISARKGDLAPKRAIADLLRSIGREAPRLGREVEESAARLATSGGFICRRTGRPGTKMAEPPFKGPIGLWIQENIAQETWREWIAQGTKVINELRLDFSRETDQETFDQHMHEFLGIDETVLGELESRRAGGARPA